jgi:hypothetical protein
MITTIIDGGVLSACASDGVFQWEGFVVVVREGLMLEG